MNTQQAVRAPRVLRPTPIEWDLLEEAWEVEAEAKLSWWDSLIVAAARRSGCTRLDSEDLAHEMRIRTVGVRNPFRDKI